MQLQYEKLRARPATRHTQAYTARDTILYALAVGAARPDACAASALRFTYEAGLEALPMMAVVLAIESTPWITDPQWGIDFTRLLHGEQMLSIHEPLPPEGVVTATEWIEEIYDKGAGKGAIMDVRRQLHGEAGQLLVETRASVFLRGAGGFGGPAGGGAAPQVVPANRAPDAVIDTPTTPDQALLYRLCGDGNPLHVDPVIARAAGFERPILHGLCTYGIAGRVLISHFCNDEAARVKRLDVRFSKPVYPGERLRTEAWLIEPGRAAFRCHVPARAVTVIDNGRFDFLEEVHDD
jgi:acyl dehydratase